MQALPEHASARRTLDPLKNFAQELEIIFGPWERTLQGLHEFVFAITAGFTMGSQPPFVNESRLPKVSGCNVQNGSPRAIRLDGKSWRHRALRLF
jgi:hypothetical protein